MKNQKFRIDPKAGVVVFGQKSHGVMFASMSKACNEDKFNVGIGQLIAMKRNEIKIRKEDIASMKDVVEKCQYLADISEGTAVKMYSYFIQITSDKIRMSYNHIRELKEDLKALYSGDFEVKPYAEIAEDHRKLRKGDEEVKKEIRKKPYAVPQEIMDGTHIFEVKGGSVRLRKCDMIDPEGEAFVV